ncbi:MAG TPA: heavy metal translocating P-type ATPase [Thermoplasmata archaeon]|nr:heavy metal translocating P-type ATPase [Thermoplasmata archaeon]
MHSVGSRARGAGRVVRTYPLPFLALAGLAVGAVLTYAFHRPDAAAAVWLVTLVGGGAPLIVRTARHLRQGKLASDVIAALAIGAAAVLDQAFAGVVIVVMQSGGLALESYAFRQASSSLGALEQRAPRRALRRRGSEVEDVAVGAVRVGDTLLVRTGDVVPVDGRVVGSSALIDASVVTGEPLPRSCAPGTTVLSGSISLGAPFDLVAERESRQSQYAQIVELVRSAQGRKPPILRLADRYAAWFTPVVIGVALFAGAYTGSAVAVLAVLVVATPCPLIIATPIAVVGAVNRASDRGIVVKSGAAIEEAGRVRVVVFDKTGTITSGQPEVERIVPFPPKVDAAGLLGRAASLEQYSSHPLAAATVRAAQRDRVALVAASAVTEFPGSGLEGSIDGRTVLVGSASLLRQRLGRPIEAEQRLLRTRSELTARLVSYVAVDGRPEGAILYADRIREGVPEMMTRLRERGVEHLVILSGDSRANSEEAGRRAGVEDVRGELLPAEKVEAVRQLRERRGPTLMVGDGINDAAALAAASVGVAMGARGAGVSTEAADVVLLVDDVTRVVDVVTLGQRMVRVARQGIWFGLGASAVLMAIASLGRIVPAVGAVLQEVIDVAVIFNALRVR